MDQAQQYKILQKALRRQGMLRLHEAQKLGVRRMTLSPKDNYKDSVAVCTLYLTRSSMSITTWPL